MQGNSKTSAYGIQRYVILWVILSFLGWCFETVFVFFAFGEWHDQGFLTLPFCPIYGTALMAVYFLAGTPDEPRGLLKNMRKTLPRYALYAVIAFLVPTLFELVVGFIFDKGFGVWLWSYQHLPYNWFGYVSLPVSLCWMLLVCVFMKWAFSWLKSLILRLSEPIVRGAALAALIALGVDFVLNIAYKLL